ncbi:hypothetical protein [Streptomyces sp. NPDC088752]|uniref:hypothetical protein n=1 Tax=Streptomyces sp. NPDC088752 TaxID=3154963 RepID=UPI00342D21CB
MSRTRLAKAPYDKQGNLITYVATYADQVHEWRKNVPFPALLELEGTTRGMSAARFVWRSDRGGAQYEMFMTDAADLLKNATSLFKGTIDTWWIAQKRGKNYGVRLATQEDLKHAGHISGPTADCPACDDPSMRYTPWCPLNPSADKPHQFRHDPATLTVGICFCGQRMYDPVHGLTEQCTCSKETRTACSMSGCQG